MDNIIYINNIEIILLGLALGVVFFIAFKHSKSIKISGILSISLIPPLYLSIEGTTQFLTVDATYIILEVIDIQHSDMGQWYQTANRTSDLIIGIIIHLVKKYTYFGIAMNLDELKMLAKALHWFFGFLLVVIIYELINIYYITKKQKTFYFILYFYSTLLLPTNILAIKIFNYDLLSMLLGTLTVVLGLIALKLESSRHALVSIVVGMLAAQEKLIASPILLVSFVIFTYITLNKSPSINYKTSLYYTFYAIFIAFLTSLTTFLIVTMVAREGYIPKLDFSSLVSPIISYLSPLIGVYKSIIGDAFVAYGNISRINQVFFTGIFLSLVAFLLAKNKSEITTTFSRTNFRWVTISVVLLVFITGFTGIYLVTKVFIYPYSPISPNDYFPPYVFNHIIRHFGVHSLLEHKVYYIGHAYAIFVTAFPLVYLLMLFFIFIFDKRDPKEILLDWQIVFLLAIFMPFLYAITNTPVSHKYFNIFLFLTILVIGLEFSRVSTQFDNFKKWGLVVIFSMALLIEVLPFRPVFSAFRSLSNWREYKEYPSFGEREGWMGWGEELFLAGKKLEKMISMSQIKPDKIHLYYLYPGEWINSSRIKVYNYWNNRVEPQNFKKTDYIVINANNIIFGLAKGIEQIKPVFTISNRGYTYAWVYRGDQLNNKRVIFEPLCKKMFSLDELENSRDLQNSPLKSTKIWYDNCVPKLRNSNEETEQ